MGREQYGVKLKALPKTQIASFTPSQFPASTTVFIVVANCLHQYAQKRAFTIQNNMDQGLSSCNCREMLNGYGSTAINGYGTGVSSMSVGVGSQITLSSIGFVADSIDFVATVGATAPTTGNLIINVVEVI